MVGGRAIAPIKIEIIDSYEIEIDDIKEMRDMKSEKIEAVFDKQEDGRDHYKGLVDGRKVLIVSMRTGTGLKEIEKSFELLINEVHGRKTPTQSNVHHSWRTENPVIILDFYDPRVSNEATIDFLEQVIVMVRDTVQK